MFEYYSYICTSLNIKIYSMKKLKLNDKQKYDLLTFCYDRIISQGKHPYHFLSPLTSCDVKFSFGDFAHNKAVVEIVYSFECCRVRLFLEYTKVCLFNDVYDFVFIPKSLCIDKEFCSSLLVAIVRDPATSYCSPIYIYQSHLSISQLCEDDSEEGDVAAGSGGACLAEADADSAHSKNENVIL